MKFILSIVLSFSLILNAYAGSREQRRNCREIQDQCERGSNVTDAMLSFRGYNHVGDRRHYCRMVFQACTRDELNKNCEEIYVERTKKLEKKRFRAQQVGGIIAAFGISVGGISMLTALFSGPHVLISGATILATVGGLGGLILGFASIKHGPERAMTIFGFEHGFGTPTKAETRMQDRFVERIENRTEEEVSLQEIQDIMQEGFNSGMYCQHYPRLFGPIAIAKHIEQRIKERRQAAGLVPCNTPH